MVGSGTAVSARARRLILLGMAVSAVVCALALPRIEQPQRYHRFADDRALLAVPNALNVLSNVPFLVTGALGLAALRRRREAGGAASPDVRVALALLYASVALVGFGSAYYHLAPDDGRLLWDRLPLAVVLATLFGIVLCRRLDMAGWPALPLAAVGVASALVWRWTGDLGPYLVVQVFAVVALPVLLLAWRPRLPGTGSLLIAAALYALAKAAELADGAIYQASNLLVSGHTAKHLLAAAALEAVRRVDLGAERQPAPHPETARG
jgi:hypothetical protein